MTSLLYVRRGADSLTKMTFSVEPPKQGLKVKYKNNRSLCFHFDLISGCSVVPL